MQETQVQSQGWEYPLGEEMAAHSSILAWRIPWTEEPGGLQFKGLQRVKHNWGTNSFTFQILMKCKFCASLKSFLLWHWGWTRETTFPLQVCRKWSLGCCDGQDCRKVFSRGPDRKLGKPEKDPWPRFSQTLQSWCQTSQATWVIVWASLRPTVCREKTFPCQGGGWGWGLSYCLCT